MAKGKGNGKRGRPKAKKAEEPTFRLREEFVLDKVKVTEIHGVRAGDTKKIGLAFLTRITPKIAGLFDVWTLLYDGNEVPRDGYSKMALDVGRIKTVALKTTAGYPGKNPLDAIPVYLGSFTIKREPGILAFAFRAVFDAYAQQLTDFWDEVGDTEFGLIVRPMQGELFKDAPVEQPKPRVVGPSSIQ